MKYHKRKKIGFFFDKTISKREKEKNRFDFLYENARIIRRKIEMEKIINEVKESNNRIPQMSNYSKRISKKKSFKILYKNLHKPIEFEEHIDQNNFLLTKTNISKNKNIKNSFSFQPLINEKSILIAKSLPIQSIERLQSLSKNQKKRREEIIHKKEKNNNLEKSNLIIKENKRCNNLYLKGLKSFKNKELLSYNAEKQKINSYRQYSFQPKINNIFNLKSNSVILTKNDIYKRNNIWKDKVDKRILKRKNELNFKKLQYENFNNTFNPKINKEIMNIDSEFIKNHISEYLTFINRYNEKTKKAFIEKKPTNHNRIHFTNKKFITNYYNTEIPYSLIKNKNNNLKNSTNLENINKYRNELGTSNFFSNIQKNKFIFFDNFNYNEVKKRSNSFTFSDAVKKLVKQIK
jgi:hypothetical protein